MSKIQQSRGSVQQNFTNLFKETMGDKNKKMMEDLQSLTYIVEKETQSHVDLAKKQQEKNKQLITNVHKYIQEFEKIQIQSNQNILQFEQSIKSRKLLQANNLDFSDFCDLPASDFPPYSEEFKKYELQIMVNNLTDYAIKQYKFRMNEEVQKQRQDIDRQIKNIISEIKKHQDPQDLPKQQIILLEELICKLSSYDNIIPYIMQDVSNKASEHVQNMSSIFVDFQNHCKNQRDRISKLNVSY